VLAALPVVGGPHDKEIQARSDGNVWPVFPLHDFRLMTVRSTISMGIVKNVPCFAAQAGMTLVSTLGDSD
jgi:hypothetical protein